MRKLKVFTHSLLLAVTPSLLVYPQNNLHSFQGRQVHLKEKKTEISHTLSYDEIMHLLNELESGELEKKCSYEDLEKINHLFAFLAKEGMLPDDSELLDDFEELLNGKDNLYKYAFSFGAHAEKIVIPVIFNEYGEAVPCKGWVQKKWRQTKKSVKKHKKAIIIGAAIVVAAAIVVGIIATSAGAAAASAAGAAGSAAAASDKQKEDPPVVVPNAPPAMEDSTLKAAMAEQILSFKEHIYTEQLFPSSSPPIPHQELSWEETGEILGHVFARESYNKLKELEYQNPFTTQKEDSYTPFGYPEIDRKSPSYAKKPDDFSTPFYWMRGERALDHGYLTEAVHDLGKAIEGNPANPLPYLERGFAHFGLGEYDRSLEDYRTYISQKPQTLSIPEFSLGFAKALPKGIYDSGKGIFLFVSDLVKHPVRTGEQIWDTLTLLSKLARSEQWGALSEVIAPEVHQLIKEWDSLPSDTRGELAGYAFGKHGSDIFIPGALAKAIAKGVKGAQELSAIYKGLQTAEKTLLLETVTGLESAKIAEVIQTSQRTIILGEDLGFTPHQMGQLKQAGNLEGVVTNTFESISKNPAMRESFAFFKKAEAFLEPYSKGFLPEMQARELIHQTRVKTFPRPEGIPDNFIVRVTDKGAGMEYMHPTNTHISVRVMPGKPHSPFPYQQKPYVIQKADGKVFNKEGYMVNKNAPEAHVPIDEFIYRSN